MTDRIFDMTVHSLKEIAVEHSMNLSDTDVYDLTLTDHWGKTEEIKLYVDRSKGANVRIGRFFEFPLGLRPEKDADT